MTGFLVEPATRGAMRLELEASAPTSWPDTHWLPGNAGPKPARRPLVGGRVRGILPLPTFWGKNPAERFV